MILKDARDNYYFHTGKVSDIVRQLALGAIAIVWIFRTGAGVPFSIPYELLMPLKLVVAGLGLDLLQYVSGALFWGALQWRKERAGFAESDDFKAPVWINWPALVCFWAKAGLTAMAYWQLLLYLANAISTD